MGVDSTDVPRLQKLFNVAGMELFESEMPKHTVVVDGFYMDRRLVTNSQFKKFTDAIQEWRPGDGPTIFAMKTICGTGRLRAFRQGKENHPVVNVSWYAAVAYCQWEGKRLPRKQSGLTRHAENWGTFSLGRRASQQNTRQLWGQWTRYNQRGGRLSPEWVRPVRHGR